MSNQHMYGIAVTGIRRPIALLSLAILAGPSFIGTADAADLSGAVTLTSQYILRGRDMSDNDPALQLGLDYEFDNGVFAGIWASTIDLENQFGERDTELDYYVGYHLASDAPIAVTMTLLRYTYPNQTAARGYEYTEALVAASFNQRYSIEFGYADKIYGFDRIGRHAEARAEWPVANTAVVSTGVGRKDIESLGIPAYFYWDLGASVRFSRLTLDLRWYDNENVIATGRRLAGSRFVVSLSAIF